jgi:uridylate kinase
MKHKKVLLKLSGESLMGELDYGLDPKMLTQYAAEIKAVQKVGCRVGVVIGGGNIFRGLQGVAKGMDRVQGDYMGMMATLINSMALQAELEKQGVPNQLLSGIAVDPIAKKMCRSRAKKYLQNGKVVIIAGGTGNPFFTTDTGAALRAIEIEADILLKGTRVDGVYTADPEKDKNATKYSTLTFDEAYQKGLSVMDLTAFTLCKENNMPIYVFDMNTVGNLLKVINGEEIGTMVR